MFSDNNDKMQIPTQATLVVDLFHGIWQILREDSHTHHHCPLRTFMALEQHTPCMVIEQGRESGVAGSEDAFSNFSWMRSKMN